MMNLVPKPITTALRDSVATLRDGASLGLTGEGMACVVVAVNTVCSVLVMFVLFVSPFK